MIEQLTIDTQDPSALLERQAFDVLLPLLEDVFEETNTRSDFLKLEPLKDFSSVYFLKSGCLICNIRMRKKSWYFSIPASYASYLPADAKASVNASDPGTTRIVVRDPSDISLCQDALRAILRDKIKSFHTFDCCGRYEACSDAGRCIHPNSEEALGCSYKRNLAKGRIFYGKNKNV